MSIPPEICRDENCGTHGCIFCRIIQGQERARVVAETDRALAILPLRMITWGHTIVFPKNHVRDMFDARWEDLSDAMWLVREVTSQLKNALGIGSLNVLQNTGPFAWQTVNHIHFHIIPRRDDGHWESAAKLFPKGDPYSDEKFDELLGKLRQG